MDWLEQIDPPAACNVRVLWKAPCAEPNGLQATASGLWVVDHSEERKVCLLRYSDGGLLHEFQVRTKRGSGITQDPEGNIWVSSTVGFEIICYDPETGTGARSFPHTVAGVQSRPPPRLDLGRWASVGRDTVPRSAGRAGSGYWRRWSIGFGCLVIGPTALPGRMRAFGVCGPSLHPVAIMRMETANDRMIPGALRVACRHSGA